MQISATSANMIHNYQETAHFYRVLGDQCLWRHGGVVVGALDFQPEARWLEAWSLPSCCFLRQETLLRIVSFNPGVQMGTCDGLVSKPGGVAILLVDSCYRKCVQL